MIITAAIIVVSLACATCLGWSLGMFIAKGNVRADLIVLITRWGDQHSRWCCHDGCKSPDGGHYDDGAVRNLMGALHGEYKPLVPTPCAEQCTCGVAEYVADVQAVMDRL